MVCAERMTQQTEHRPTLFHQLSTDEWLKLSKRTTRISPNDLAFSLSRFLVMYTGRGARFRNRTDVSKFLVVYFSPLPLEYPYIWRAQPHGVAGTIKAYPLTGRGGL
jgi:hypothetical protein